MSADNASPHVFIRFWGVRGSTPAPGPETVYVGGNTTCVEIRVGNEIIILDAGTGIRRLGLALAEEFQNQPLSASLLISHTHWDHIQGFPFFLPAWDARNSIRILGMESAQSSLRNILAGQMDSVYFPVPMRSMPGYINIKDLNEMHFHIGEVPVTACIVNHPGPAAGYRFHTPAGDIVFIPDNEPSGPRWWGTPEKPGLEKAVSEFIRDADILICDAQYDAEEYAKRIDWGHGAIDDVVKLAANNNVGKLYLFHHDPDHDDARVMAMSRHATDLAHELGSPLKIHIAREGLKVDLA